MINYCSCSLWTYIVDSTIIFMFRFMYFVSRYAVCILVQFWAMIILPINISFKWPNILQMSHLG